MLLVTVELLPRGDRSGRRVLGTAEIVNNEKGGHEVVVESTEYRRAACVDGGGSDAWELVHRAVGEALALNRAMRYECLRAGAAVTYGMFQGHSLTVEEWATKVRISPQLAHELLEYLLMTSGIAVKKVAENGSARYELNR